MNTEYPIIFSPGQVTTILEGRETQTRRVIKQIKPEWVLTSAMEKIYTGILRHPFPHHIRYNSKQIDRYGIFVQTQTTVDDYDTEFIPCPCGNIGGQLWVRETWRTDIMYDEFAPSILDVGDPVQYKADENNYQMSLEGKWRPSIHMPRWASRINLKIIDIRVERIQVISLNDIVAEGIEIKIPGVIEEDNISFFLKRHFRLLWNSIYTKRGYEWDINSYVWVIKFKRLENETIERIKGEKNG